MTKSKFVGFLAPPDLVGALADAATRQERSVSAEIRFAIRKHLNESAQPAEAERSQNRAKTEPASAKA